MRLAFAGTPEFARVARTPARRATMSRSSSPSPIALRPRHEVAHRPSGVALEHGIAVVQPRGLRLDGRFADDAPAMRSSPRRPT
jgi:methionyl-tRNA formyltransferase